MSTLDNMSKSEKRISGLLILLLGIYIGYYAIEVMHGEIAYPMDCHYKRLLCDMENSIFKEGGYFAIGMVYIAMSLMVTFFGVVVFGKKPD